MSRPYWQRCQFCGEMGSRRWWCGEVDGRPCWYEPMCVACHELCRRGDAAALTARWRYRYGDRARREAAEHSEGFAEVRAKRCGYDGAWLPISAFDRFAPGMDGYRYYCRDCMVIAGRERRAKDRVKLLAAIVREGRA